MTDVKDVQARLVRGGAAALRVYGKAGRAERRRLQRLAEAGVIGCVRVGERQDRWYSTAELDRLIASAETSS